MLGVNYECSECDGIPCICGHGYRYLTAAELRGLIGVLEKMVASKEEKPKPKPRASVGYRSYHSDAIDPNSLVEGQKVEVRYCDASASCVWSHPAVARRVGGKMWLLQDGHSFKMDPLVCDGCYTYLTEQIKRAR